MQINTQQQAIFNVSALRLAINLRKNLEYFPRHLQADFLTMTNFIEELENYEERQEGKANGQEGNWQDRAREITRQRARAT